MKSGKGWQLILLLYNHILNNLSLIMLSFVKNIGLALIAAARACYQDTIDIMGYDEGGNLLNNPKAEDAA